MESREASANPTRPPSKSIFRWSVQTKLILGYLFGSAFTLLICVLSLYLFSGIRNALTDVTGGHVPEMRFAISIAAESHHVALLTSRLRNVDSETQRAQLIQELIEQWKKLKEILQSFDQSPFAGQDTELFINNFDFINVFLSETVVLDTITENRLAIKKNNEFVYTQFLEVQQNFNTYIQTVLATTGETIRELSSSLAENQKNEFDYREKAILLREKLNLNDTFLALNTLGQDLFAWVLEVNANDDIRVLNRNARLALLQHRKIRNLYKTLPPDDQEVMDQWLIQIFPLMVGEQAIMSVRRREIRLHTTSETLLQAHQTAANDLEKKATMLAQTIQNRIDQASAESEQQINRHSYLLIGFTLLSFISVLFIIWFYVGKRLILPLVKISKTMRLIAQGELQAPMPEVVNDEVGDMVHALEILKDHVIQTRELADEQISLREITEKSRQQAEAANQAKSEFLANMSHEIRTPMNAILGFTEILEEHLQSPQQKEYLNAIRSSGKSLLGLINDILDLSKVEAGKLELEYSEVNLQDLFIELEQIFSSKIEEKGLEFRIHISDDFPQGVILDEIRLRQILLNLIGNAIKFTDNGFIRLSVYFQLQNGKESTESFIFMVEDTGIGIPEDQFEWIFGAFDQRKGMSHAKYGGTGLGLAITKRLVELMGGEIVVASEVGKGSIFYILFKNIQSVAITELNKHQVIDFELGPIHFNPATLLVVDDIEMNRKLIRSHLYPFEIEILEAENGQKGIELAQAHLPDLIFMDMKMPVMDGYEATRFLKNDEKLKTIPVVAVTASAMKDDEAKQAALCDTILQKPINKTDLLNLLKGFLNHTTDQGHVSNSEPLIVEPHLLESELLSEKTIAHLPELLKILEGELFDEWKLWETFAFDEVEAFAAKVKLVGEHYHYSTLVNWCNQLEFQAQMFDSLSQEKTLNQFPDLIASLKHLMQTGKNGKSQT